VRQTAILTCWNSAIAVAGCLIAILSVAIGPFVQQSIRTVVCEQPDPSASAATAATISMPGSYSGINLSHPFDLKIESAIVNTMINPSLADNGVPFLCSTGNCSFPTVDGVSYTTLGACSKCFDITSLVREVKIPPYTSAGVLYDGHNYTLPNGIAVALLNATVDNRTDYQSYQSFEVGAAGPGQLDWALPVLREKDPKTFSEWEAIFSVAITVVSFLQLRNCKGGPCPYQGLLNLTSLPRSWNLEAYSCVLYGCLKSMNGKVELGKATETVVSSAVLTPLGSTMRVASIPEFTTIPTIDPIPVGGSSGSSPLGSRALSEDENPEEENDPNEGVWATIKDPCTIDGISYGHDNFSFVPRDNNITMISVSLFHNSSNSSSSSNKDSGSKIEVPSPCFYRIAKKEYYDARDVILTLFDSCPGSNSTGSNALILCEARWWLKIFRDNRRNVASKMAIFDAIAAAMTNQLRELGRSGDGVGPGLVYGMGYRTMACTQIERWWLVFPVVLVGLSVFLLGVVMLQTGLSVRVSGSGSGSGSGNGERIIPDWKSSTLPLLFNWTQQMSRYQDVVDLKAIKAHAQGWSMYLGGEPGRCELRVRQAVEDRTGEETRTPEWEQKGP